MNFLPYHWRISKYDPARRDANGHYLVDDWTFFAQVGQTFGGKQLTYKDYVSVESAYVRSAMLFLLEADLNSLHISELQIPLDTTEANSQIQDIRLDPMTLQNGGVYAQTPLEDIIRLALREVIACKLEEPNTFYMHFGWDYYLYIGSSSRSSKAIEAARLNGLYVEPMISPYL